MNSSLSGPQICARCIMDSAVDTAIRFDEKGFCNHCNRFIANQGKFLYQPGISDRTLEKLVSAVKRAGHGKDFDCVIGISGGIDSSYLARMVKKWGLRPLAVHVDNGWNSKVAVANIKRLLGSMRMELYTQVLDWDAFKDMQLAFFKASVIDVENPTDMAIAGSLQRVAAKFGIKSILLAGNYATEGMTPSHFQSGRKDLRYLRAIHRQFGQRQYPDFPSLGFWDELKFKFVHGIKFLYPMNHLDYKKNDALAMLKRDYGWEDYGGKHHESIFTKFVQSYYLPVKFNVDYRKSTLSAMICSGQVKREDALSAVAHSPYDAQALPRDIAYLAKKFGIPDEEFRAILALPPKFYTDYPNSERFLRLMHGAYRTARGWAAAR